MRYLVSVIHDQAGQATRDEHAAIDVFNDRLQAEGHWVFAGGLAATETATVIDNRGEEAMFTDGLFRESKEYLAGFWIIEAADLDVALKLAAEGRRPAIGRSRYGRSCEWDRRAGGDHPGPPRGVGRDVVHPCHNGPGHATSGWAVSFSGSAVRHQGEGVPPAREAAGHGEESVRLRKARPPCTT